MGLCNELRQNPSKIFTAAPLPGQAKVAMENALHLHPERELLAINLGTPFTATPRNVQAAADALSDDLKASPVPTPFRVAHTRYLPLYAMYTYGLNGYWVTSFSP